LRPYGSGANVLPFSADDLSAGAANVVAPFAPAGAESVGRLFIDTEPSSAQIFVDGIPVGAVADFRGVGVLLTEGVRRVEVRAPGYETAAFDINILAQQSAVYRGDLALLRPVAGPVVPAARRGSDAFYVIPGCYAGNRPPRERTLPKGCDIARSKKIS
jgi:PEGA domain